MKVYLVDDEPLALKRLTRLLAATGRAEVVGSATNPELALEFLRSHPIDALFLDIEMPVLSGFELLSRLEPQPLVVFTTAFDQFALRAFEVNSIDYLLKPIVPEQLDRALSKLERILGGASPAPPLSDLLDQILRARRSTPDRIASRSGDRIEFIPLASITHFYAEDKLTFASTPARSFVVDQTIAELEERLEPAGFLRIHRATLVNLKYIKELHSWFGGRMMLRLNDEKRTELTVSRDRVRALKQRLEV